MQVPGTTWRARRPAGFTMIELLVVIAVLALLIGLVTFVASKAIHQQKVRNTQQIMQNATLAIEQFATANPLRAIYDRKDRQTFGEYPPYQLLENSSADSVTQVVESDAARPGGAGGTLCQRLKRDVLNQANPGAGNEAGLIELADNDTANDDIRALHAYLGVFAPSALSQIPEGSQRPLPNSLPQGEFINSSGNGANVQARTAVLGIHDAWGVPLDYMLCVKCEWRLRPDGTTGFWVTERRPVLRSRGIDREVYDAWRTADDETKPHLSPPDKWLFSEDSPRPWFGGQDPGNVGADGSFSFSGASFNGWVRAVGLNEDCAYRPDGDARE